MGTEKFNDAQIKHEKYVDRLCSKILPEYDSVKKNVKLYYSSKKIAGEIDVLACNGNTCDLYEVKCSRRIVKAKIQTTKIRKTIDKDRIYRIRHVYFYCGESDVIERLSGNDKKIERKKDIEMPPSVKNLY